MKRIIAAVLLLSLLSVASFCMIGSIVGEEKANVMIKENVIYGDKSYAEGVTVLARANYDDHLFWNTSYTIGDNTNASTEYEFYYSEHYENEKKQYNGITLDVDLKYGFDLKTPVSESKGLQKAYRELYDATPQGGKGTKMIRLQDYYDYYPIRVHVDLPGVLWSGNDYRTLYSKNARDVWDKFNDYFKIPIPKDLPAFEISIEKGNNSIGTSGMALEFYFNAINAYTSDKVFFAISNKYMVGDETEEHYIDTSLIPGGYGIYAINYRNVRNSDRKSHYVTDYDTGIDHNSLTTVFPLEQYQEVIHMTLSNDRSKLMVFTKENSSIMHLTVIDIETMTQLQKIEIGAIEQYSIFEYDNCIVFRGANDIAVIEKRNDGLCDLAFAVPRMTEIEQNIRFTGYATVMAFDGERLAIVERMTDEYHNTAGLCGFEVAIYTTSGLVYYGEYESSLSSAADPSDYTINCDLQGYSVRFE